MTIPTLDTPRLRLRPHRPDDLAACAALWADPGVVRFITGRPQSREESWTRLLRYAGHWAWLGFGYWALEEQAGGAYVGELGFADFKREGLPFLAGRPELGWALSPAVQGRGYATEAVTAALAWGDVHLPAAETACIIAPENLASLRVAAKLGYREVERVARNGGETILFTRARGG